MSVPRLRLAPVVETVFPTSLRPEEPPGPPHPPTLQGWPMSIHVRAPASTANVGPGFDAAAVAFDLWNELEISEANGAAPDFGHLGVRAFARVTPRGELGVRLHHPDSA